MPSDPEHADIVDVAVRVGRALSGAGARYALVGSVASSLQGDPRSTNDVDFVSTLLAEEIPSFVRLLGDEFDVDEVALAQAIQSGGSWNIYFLPWMIKIDLFAAADSELQRTQLNRAFSMRVGTDGLTVLRPDDLVLSKLLWYRDGGGVSDQQWRDIIGVLRVSRSQMDSDYLNEWARRLGLEALLKRARDETH